MEKLKHTAAQVRSEIEEYRQQIDDLKAKIIPRRKKATGPMWRS